MPTESGLPSHASIAFRLARTGAITRRPPLRQEAARGVRSPEKIPFNAPWRFRGRAGEIRMLLDCLRRTHSLSRGALRFRAGPADAPIGTDRS